MKVHEEKFLIISTVLRYTATFNNLPQFW